MRHESILRGNVKAELARRDWQGRQAAEAIGMTPAMFSSRLHGRTQWRIAELVELSQVLDVPFSRLIAGVDEAQTVPLPEVSAHG